MFFFNVIVGHAFCNKPYIYSSEIDLNILSVVSVEFNTKICFGVIVSKSCSIEKCKMILKNHEYVISFDFFDFINKVAWYYFLNIGAVLEIVFPSISFQKAPCILISFDNKIEYLLDVMSKFSLKDIKKIQNSSNVFENYFNKKCLDKNIVNLTQDQKDAVETINKSKKVCLLRGVTGSGKTIVIINCINYFKNKVLILVPEINLARHWIDSIKNNFNISPFVYHSKISKVLKKSFFNWAISSEPGIVVGTRSALMIPYKNLDCIIVDEEHSVSYRQDFYPYYNARDMAVLMGSILGVKVILLSATPCLETILNVKKNRYDIAILKRTPKHGLAKIEYIKGETSMILSNKIIQNVSEKFKQKEQVLFFLNRKGYAPYCSCNLCKNLLLCKDCDHALTLYSNFKVLCHKCYKKFNLPRTCPYCLKYTTWSFWGLGVEKLNEFLKNIFPDYNFIVVTSESKNIDLALQSINENRVNGIISTQILIQGHDFKNIGLVVVVDADMGLISTDFRAMEKIYQLWQQLRGRSGRHDLIGKMILQFFKDENKFVKLFQQKDIYKFLLDDRLTNQWPPFYKCAFLKFKGKNKEKLQNEVENVNFDSQCVFGPLFWEVKNKIFEFRFLIKAKNYTDLRLIIKSIIEKFPKSEVEIDPY